VKSHGTAVLACRRRLRVVDPDAVLTAPLTLQRLEPIAGRGVQIPQRPRAVQVDQFAPGLPFDSLQAPDRDVVEQRFKVPVPEGPDHRLSIL
jgi:hypothetical protein